MGAYALMLINELDRSHAIKYRELRLEALLHDKEAFQTTYEDYVTRPLEQIAEQLDPSPDKFTLAAWETETGVLLGTVTLLRCKSSKTRHIADVVAMHVSLGYRGRGVGRALLQELIQRARLIQGLDQLRLGVVTDNEAALGLYRSIGFEEYGVERRALKSENHTWDEALMCLIL